MFLHIHLGYLRRNSFCKCMVAITENKSNESSLSIAVIAPGNEMIIQDHIKLGKTLKAMEELINPNNTLLSRSEPSSFTIFQFTKSLELFKIDELPVLRCKFKWRSSGKEASGWLLNNSSSGFIQRSSLKCFKEKKFSSKGVVGRKPSQSLCLLKPEKTFFSFLKEL